MKNKFIKSMVILLCISIVICSFTSSITVAKENGNILTNKDVEKIKLNEVTNLNNVLKSLKLSKQNIIDNNYKIKREKVGFINAKDKDGKYYNFYLEGNDIKYYSV
ncbi:hypothetical protein [Staphylococcus lutrae]|uniref:hypothetical protein n=1 Tax=Staphylococcus lutrae TaxID=155085 RepID=UPI001F0C6F21|nr:hypothetical protein [Staphylococcus lutrae]